MALRLRVALALLVCAASAAAREPQALVAPQSGSPLDRVPLNPAYDRDYLYQPPFDRRVHWLVGQGNSDAFSRCCLPLERVNETNGVTVLHRDGSFADYAHLRPGIPVKPQQSVKEGELLGYSGITGYAQVPHLHFQVSIRDAPGSWRSIPVRFRNAADEGYTPKSWRLYVNRPPATVGLKVSVAGRRVEPLTPFFLESRAPIQLRVERIDASGAATDVTRDPGTRYFALTPWSLGVDAAGRVTFGTPGDWTPLADFIRRGVAIATILFDGEGGLRGAFDARLAFEDMRSWKPKAGGS